MTHKTTFETQDATNIPPHILGRISSPALAVSFAARVPQACRFFMGDDELIWVVTMAEAERLLAAGYEEFSFTNPSHRR